MRRKKSFGAVVGEGCRALVLGSLPGDESLRRGEYYAHPRNVFWRMMGELCGFMPDLPYEVRLERLVEAGVALWDVVGSGVRVGSLDANIREEAPNDIETLFHAYPKIGVICCNGGAAYRYLKRYFPGVVASPSWCVHQLPSTSPAAARLSYDEKLRAYREALAPVICRG